MEVEVQEPETQKELREFRGNNYKVIFDCRDPMVLLSGPAGCVAGETRIHDERSGTDIPIRSMVKNQYAPVVMTAIGPIQAEVPFLKGKDRIIRVVMQSGREIRVIANHKFLSPIGWIFADSISVGEELLVSELCHRQTISGNVLEVHGEDGRRSNQTIPDSKDHYSHGFHLCDGQPRSSEVGARASFPLQSDVLERTHADWPLDDLASIEGCSHAYQAFFRLSKQDCLDRIVETLRCSPQILGETPSHAAYSSRWSDLSQTGIFRRDEARLSDHHEEQLHSREAILVSSLHHEWHVGLDVSKDLASVLLAALACPDGKVPRSFLAALSSSCDSSAPCSLSPKFLSTVLWDRVREIHFEGEEDYYDLHVPVAEHYVAEGFVNHNTGKSAACISKLHLLCLHVPNIRCLMVRKTRHSLAEAALVTFEKFVNVGQLHVDMGTIQRSHRHSYKYSNGSEIVLGGMDDPSKVMSTEFDVVYAQEATELTENDWDALSSRIRNGRLPYQQFIADCNPSYPQHWLKKRCDAGRILLLPTFHKDNPAFFERDKVMTGKDGQPFVIPGKMTKRGREYMERLDALTGPRRLRLRDGKWVQAEGVVYEEWDDNVNVIDRRPIPRDWTRFISIDFGFQDPFVVHWYASDNDRRLYLYREIVQTMTLVEDMAKEIINFIKLDKVQPAKIICDHDAEGRATLEKHLGRMTTPAAKDIIGGIQSVAARLRKQDDGFPRLMVMRDSLVRRDQRMEEKGLPIGLLEEVGAYCWADKIRKEIPEGGSDHSLDTVRYLVHTLDRPQAPFAFRII